MDDLEYEDLYSDVYSGVPDAAGDSSNTTSAPSNGQAKQYRPPPPAQQQQSSNRPFVRPSEMPGEGKMFIGGLNWETTDDKLRSHFEQYGTVEHCSVLRDSATGRSRGFAFLTFTDSDAVDRVLADEHFIDGKLIDPKRALSRDEQQRTSKLFVNHIPSSVDKDTFRLHFAAFGHVVDCTLKSSDARHKSNFGFITYESESDVDNALAHAPHEFDGTTVETKKTSVRPPTKEDNRPRSFGNNNSNTSYSNNQQSSNDSSSPQQSNTPFNPMMFMPQMMAAQQQGGAGANQFDPVAMANFFKQMGWGWNNPAMMGYNNMGMGGMGMNGMGMSNMGGMGGMGMGGMGGMGMNNMGGMADQYGYNAMGAATGDDSYGYNRNYNNNRAGSGGSSSSRGGSGRGGRSNNYSSPHQTWTQSNKDDDGASADDDQQQSLSQSSPKGSPTADVPKGARDPSSGPQRKGQSGRYHPYSSRSNSASNNNDGNKSDSSKIESNRWKEWNRSEEGEVDKESH